MPDFQTNHAAALLEAHRPGGRAYQCAEIGLEANGENASKVDAAYAELCELGYMEEHSEHKVMPYSGSVAKSTYEITAEGLAARE